MSVSEAVYAGKKKDRRMRASKEEVKQASKKISKYVRTKVRIKNRY